MATEDLDGLVRKLRATGGDTASVEVKSAAGGLPASISSTLSALANLPGGGLVILGLDERTGFRPVPLADPQALKQGLAAKARTFSPPVHLTIEDGTVDGAPVIVARVHECDSSAKPCRIASSGSPTCAATTGTTGCLTLRNRHSWPPGGRRCSTGRLWPTPLQTISTRG